MKKVVAAIMVLLFMCSPAAVFAAEPFSLLLSGTEAVRGGGITLSGTTPGPDDTIVVKVVSPGQTVFYIDVLTAVDGAYSQRLAIPASLVLAPSGTYTVIAGSGGTALTRTFTIEGEDSGTPDPGTPDPETPDPGTPDDPDPVTPGKTGSGQTSPVLTIPAGAGEAGDGRITPELSGDGRYLVGADTLTEALQQAAGKITIVLPAIAAETGAALELPAKSLEALNAGNQALVITDGVRTVSFPAGALKLAGDDLTRLRIILNASWDTEARSLIDKSTRGDAAYASTGVLLSVVIQLVNGSSITEIHELEHPADVSLKLTEAQNASMKEDLAGIYYVDGSGSEYVPGTVADGAVAFQASHFSTYALLVYDKNFADMTGHWAEADVKSLAAKHLVNGVDATHYEPSRGITRAEFVAVLMRAVERTGSAPAAPASMPFTDVPSSSYYAEQAAEAAAMSIMNGYGGAFRPSDRITREEAAVALVHASKYFKLAAGSKSSPAYADLKDISSWAAASVTEAGVSGLMQGDGSKFHPKKQVTRAEVAAMVNRLIQSGSSL